jgi:hypothetical protein
VSQPYDLQPLTYPDILLLRKTLWHTDMTLKEGMEVAGFDSDSYSDEYLEDLVGRLERSGVRFSDDHNCWITI